MKSLFLCFLVFVTVFGDEEFSGAAYQRQNRQAKVGQLWAQMIKDQEPVDYYNALVAGTILIESMNTTLMTVADDMPQQYVGNFYERKKLIHTTGVHVLAELKITNNKFNYSGILRTGCDAGIIRLSLAAAADPTAGLEAYKPGISFKMLRDRVASHNFISMFSLAGQKSANFFANDLTNHVPSPNPSWMSTPEKLLLRHFKEATDWPTMIGLSDAARFDQYGNEYKQMKFPYRVIWHPNTKYHTGFPPEDTGTPFYELLVKGLSVGHVYDLYVQDQPGQGNDQIFKLGEVHLQGPAITSHFGDRSYFTQHTPMEDDFKVYPQWVPGADADVAEQERFPNRPGFRYPNLPWN